MSETPPFLDDDSQFGVSRTAFRRMRKAEKRELMISWFHQNFEDPAENTSYVSAEGGYMWNHGGPYDAKEQLFDKFGDIVPESQIEEVVTEVESDGLTDWAGTAYHENEPEDEEPPELSPFDAFSDQANERYGSQQDHDERERVRTALEDFLAALEEQRPAGIGHNNPPDDLEGDDVEEVRAGVIALRTEFEKPNPSIALVKMLGTSLKSAAGRSIRWVGRKADLAVDVAVKTGVSLAVTDVGVSYDERLHQVLDAIISWLNVVAYTVF